MASNNNTPIVIVPDEGKFLTQAADVEILNRIIATTIVLGKNDTRSNWIEIDQAQADEYMALKEKEMEERRARVAFVASSGGHLEEIAKLKMIEAKYEPKSSSMTKRPVMLSGSSRYE